MQIFTHFFLIFNKKVLSLHHNLSYCMKKLLFITAISVLSLSTACTPKQPNVAQKRAEKRAQDSINLLMQEQSLRYSDSMILVLQQQVEPLMKQFVYEKNDLYEDHGSYVYKSLKTNNNTARCYLQTYITDDFRLAAKGYYVGSYPLHINAITLLADSMQQSFSGVNHSFETELYHEIFTLDDENSTALLQFISAFENSKLRIQFLGTKSTYRFVLAEQDKHALIETLRLATLMKDIHQLELQARQASLQIQKYQNRRENVKNNEK